jgi:type VI secretion system ImpM family protein
VFGLIRKAEPWEFALFGKHPLAGDYLSMGSGTPLLKGYATWMDQGYSRIPADKAVQPGLNWRFWAKGPNSKLVIGMIKTSSDKFGRHYPLLVIGEGRAQDMVSDWDVLPFVCEQTWATLEIVGNRNWETLKKLNRLLTKIKGPEKNWSVYRDRKEKVRSVAIVQKRPGASSDFMNKMNNADVLARQDKFAVRIDVSPTDKYLIPVSKLLTLIKNRAKAEPGTVFIGGTGPVRQMVFIKRSLLLNDFTPLWISQGTIHEEGR